MRTAFMRVAIGSRLWELKPRIHPRLRNRSSVLKCVGNRKHAAFKVLMRRGCTSVPRFYGYYERKQREFDLVPGVYIKYVVWKKVSRESLTQQYFWSLAPTTREEMRVRVRVRAAYDSRDVLRCGMAPEMYETSKIIL
ncbi:hypothetical protein N7539_007073 [Penicillium diatomitis]|uniref:Uncharacterized protein n=1 Tax=Penicillium diatomitis TaxID=2819901 RepID=A0A9W9X2E0_9EURO|nr:uncharacterized protein N7539_007073 [Penicillium diatomitis]KAJ5481179.1 hypothetical protein N7539_007073 [Penicillium diatomitis]